MFIRAQFQIQQDALTRWVYLSCFVFFVLFMLAVPTFAEDAELTNLIVKNSNDELQVDLMIKGILSQEMRAIVSKGIPISLTFLILLYEVRDYWFDNKMISKTVVHEVRFDVLKKEYRIWRSWEERAPQTVKNFEKAQSLFYEIKGFDVVALSRLKKGKHYQLRVKSELNKNKVRFTGFPWEFETNWYTINFIY